MDILAFNDIFNYWLNLHNKTYYFTYEFLPFIIKKALDQENKDKITIQINYTEYTNTDTRSLSNSYFIEKDALANIFLKIHEQIYFTFNNCCTGKLQLTANTLWHNRFNFEKYNMIWLFSLIKQLIDNFSDTILPKDALKLLQYLNNSIIEFSDNEKISLPKHTKQGSLILPKGILFCKDFNSPTINNVFDLLLLIFNEKQSINSRFQLCAIRDKIEEENICRFYNDMAFWK